MGSKNILKTVLMLGVIVINIGCDQVSKKMIRHSIHPYETIHFLQDHLTVTRVENSGAFLSAGDSLPKGVKQVLLSLLPLIAVTLGLFYVLSAPAIRGNILLGLCFVIGGGIGNLFDRIVHGSVTDFLHINFEIFQTGIFNLADVSIMTGMSIILLEFVFKRKQPVDH